MVVVFGIRTFCDLFLTSSTLGTDACTADRSESSVLTLGCHVSSSKCNHKLKTFRTVLNLGVDGQAGGFTSLAFHYLKILQRH